jgi:hypothetical protein
MSTYGRNFDFRTPPDGAERGARFTLDPDGDDLVIGAPVMATGDEDAFGRLIVAVVDGETAKPAPGYGGIMLFEHAPSAYAGFDPLLTLYSDLGTAKAGAAVQVINGNGLKVVFRNTADSTFLHTRSYTGTKMVDETLGGATPTVSIGDLLTPNASPSSTNGFWQVTATAANGWLKVVGVDSTRGEVEATIQF